jgi:hypothetical protein
MHLQRVYHADNIEEKAMEDMRRHTIGLVESADERASRELVKRLRKLRWIGKENEAKELEESLSSSGRRECVLAGPCETD